jgi:hypothetical protein
MASPFTYLARDLLTWAPLDPLPYVQVQFGRVLDQHGAWKGSLPLADERVQKFAWKDATQPSKTALFVDLNGTLVWGGIIWTSNYNSDDPSHMLPVTATEFGSYFQHRLQAEDYGKIWESGEDPMKVTRRVIEDAQTVAGESPGHITGSAIPVILNPVGGSGVSIPVSYPATSLQTIDSITSTLTQMGYGAGFDFSWDVAYLSGTKTPAVVCNLWYPLKGRTAEESGIVILGKEAKWTWPVDGTPQANEVTETGSGTNGLEPATASSSTPGYPLLQKATARTQVTTQALLDEIAIGDLALAEYPSVTPSLVLPVPLPGTPAAERGALALGEFDVGDRLIFRIDPVEGGGQNTSPRFPEGCEFEWRTQQWTCTPADHGLSTVQIDLGPPPLGFVPAPAPPI